MSELLTEKSCTDFTALLAAKTSVPGGGGAAAMAGALGTALGSMVGNFTVGKKKYAAYEENIKAALQKAETLRERLLELVNADAEAFEPLSKAYSIPKDDPSRDSVLEEATLNACKAPVEMVECCCEAVELLEVMLERGSVLLVSDAGCGALLCKAAMECAAMNVYINTGTLKDREAAADIEKKVDGLLKEYGERAAAVSEEVLRRIRK